MGRMGVEGEGARARKALNVSRPPNPAAKLPSFSEEGLGRRVLTRRLFA